MAVPAESQRLTGRVVSVNPKGLKLDGQDIWLNFSKFATDLVPPARGQTVTLTLDRQGFVRAVEALAGPKEPSHGRSATTSQRDATITRLAVLKAAAAFGASRPDLKSGDVLRIADSWLTWVLDDLADTF